MTLYTDLIEAGIEVSNHESDLYFHVTPESTEILKRYPNLWRTWFTSNIDKRHMYDVAFAYDPFWERRR